MLQFYAGENPIVRRGLTVDGDDLLVANISFASVQVIQSGEVLKEWKYNGTTFDTGFRASGDAGLELQIDSEFSLGITPGLIRLRWRVKFTDAAMVVDDGKRARVYLEDALVK